MGKTAGSKDPRTLRTKQLLTEALLNLTRNTRVDCITVSQLADIAQINRATFYRHFGGMPGFINQLTDEMFEDLQPPPDPPIFLSYDAAVDYYTRFFESVKKHERFFSTMLGRNGLPDFRQRFIAKRQMWHKDIIRAYCSGSGQNIDLELLTFSFIAILLGFIEYWLNCDPMRSPEYMAKQLVSLTHGSILQHLRRLNTS